MGDYNSGFTLNYLRIKGSSPFSSEYNIRTLMLQGIELENAKLILNKHIRKMRLLIE